MGNITFEWHALFQRTSCNILVLVSHCWDGLGKDSAVLATIYGYAKLDAGSRGKDKQ